MDPKNVFYEPAGRIHPSQWELINYPPDGYRFVVGGTPIDKAVVNNSFIFDKLRLQVLDRIMPLNLVKAQVDTLIRKVPEDTRLIYSYNHLIFREIPWVVNVEWAHILVGRDLAYFGLCKHLVERLLASDYCRKILTWTEAAKKSILMNYNCHGFEHKIEVVSPAVHSKSFARVYDRDKVRLLFVGSPDDPEDFAFKGGEEVFQVFLALNRKYTNLELVMRARVPKDIKIILGIGGNVRIIDETLPQEAMAREFEEADIFLFPSHKFHNTVVLEAMSYGLPVVATEIGASGGEYVEDGITGFVVPSAKEIPYFFGDFVLTSETIHRGQLLKAVRKPQPKVVSELVERVGLLIDNPSLRWRMGGAAKWAVDYGKFSIKGRNGELKRIFDEAI